MKKRSNLKRYFIESPYLWLCIGLSIIETFILIVNPIIQNKLYTDYENEEEHDQIIWGVPTKILFGYAIAVISYNLIYYIRESFQERVAKNIKNKVSIDLWNIGTKMSFQEKREHSDPIIKAKIDSASQAVTEILELMLHTIPTGIDAGFSSIIIGYYYGILSCLFLALALIPVISATSQFIPKLKKLENSRIETENLSSEILADAISNYKTIKTYNLSAAIEKKISKVFEIEATSSVHAKLSKAIVSIIRTLITGGCLLGILKLIDSGFRRNVYHTKDMIFIYSLLYPVISDIESLSAAIINIKSAQNNLKNGFSLYKIIQAPTNEPPKLSEKEKAYYANLFKEPPSISFENVSYSDKNLKIIDNISFEIESHQVFGIIGPSQAGKSTILDLLQKNLKLPDLSGKIILKFSNNVEKNLEDIHPEILSEYMICVSQTTGIFSSDNWIENIRVVAPNENVEDIKTILKKVGLKGQDFDKPVGNCSLRDKKKIEIARVLIKRPKILLLDDPLTDLDKSDQYYFLELLTSYQAYKQTTIVMATSQVKFLKNANKIAVLSRKSEGYGYIESSDYVNTHKLLAENCPPYKDMLVNDEQIGEQNYLFDVLTDWSYGLADKNRMDGLDYVDKYEKLRSFKEKYKITDYLKSFHGRDCHIFSALLRQLFIRAHENITDCKELITLFEQMSRLDEEGNLDKNALITFIAKKGLRAKLVDLLKISKKDTSTGACSDKTRNKLGEDDEAWKKLAEVLELNIHIYDPRVNNDATRYGSNSNINLSLVYDGHNFYSRENWGYQSHLNDKDLPNTENEPIIKSGKEEVVQKTRSSTNKLLSDSKEEAKESNFISMPIDQTFWNLYENYQETLLLINKEEEKMPNLIIKSFYDDIRNNIRNYYSQERGAILKDKNISEEIQKKLIDKYGYLCLDYNQIDNFENIISNKIRILKFENFILNESALKNLCRALSTNDSIEIIDFSNTQITAKVIQEIFRNKTLDKLRFIDVTNNFIDPKFIFSNQRKYKLFYDNKKAINSIKGKSATIGPNLWRLHFYKNHSYWSFGGIIPNEFILIEGVCFAQQKFLLQIFLDKDKKYSFFSKPESHIKFNYLENEHELKAKLYNYIIDDTIILNREQGERFIEITENDGSDYDNTKTLKAWVKETLAACGENIILSNQAGDSLPSNLNETTPLLRASVSPFNK